MEFGWSPEEEAHRQRVRRVLETQLPEDWEQIALHGPGSDEQVAYSKVFCRMLAEEGLLIPHWPAEYGEAMPNPGCNSSSARKCGRSANPADRNI